MDEKFDLYLEQYCACYRISKTVGAMHAIVRAVKQYYEEEEALQHDTSGIQQPDSRT